MKSNLTSPFHQKCSEFPVDAKVFQEEENELLPISLEPDSCDRCRGLGFIACGCIYCGKGMGISDLLIEYAGDRSTGNFRIDRILECRCDMCGHSYNPYEFYHEIAETCLSCLPTRRNAGRARIENVLQEHCRFLLPDIIPIIADYAMLNSDDVCSLFVSHETPGVIDTKVKRILDTPPLKRKAPESSSSSSSSSSSPHMSDE